MRFFRYLLILFLLGVFTLMGNASAATYSLGLKYKPTKDFPLLKEKIGATLGLAPFKDERKETLYIGYHLSFFGSASYFKSDPSPLERAIEESLLGPLFKNGIKTTPISAWDGKPDSLKGFDTDSVLMIEIKQFWMEGSGAAFRTNTKTSIHMVIHLGALLDEDTESVIKDRRGKFSQRLWK